MAIKSSGFISFDDIVTEFGGTAPHAIDEYYRGGSEVPDTATNSSIPTTGTISLSNFYSASDWSAPVATGGTITTSPSGAYKIHTFTSSTNFIVSSIGNISTMEVRMVGAGGGGGGSVGNNHTGNYKHGSGGYAAIGWNDDFHSLSTGTYTVTVGAKGPYGNNGSHDHECSNPGAGGLTKLALGATTIHSSAGGAAGQSCHRSYSSCPTAGQDCISWGTGGAAGSCGGSPSAGGHGGDGAGGGGAGSGYFGTNWGAIGGYGGLGHLEIRYRIIPSSDWSAPVATGGTITTSGDYKIHTFTSSGNFVVSSIGDIDTMEIKVIGAGGGGGGSVGNNHTGNYKHGSGGYAAIGWNDDFHSLSTGTYTVTVGAKGPYGNNGSHDHECSNPGAGGLSKVVLGATTIHSSAGGAAGQSCHRSYGSCPTAGASSAYGTGGAAGSCGGSPSAGGNGGTGAGGGGAGSGYFGTNWGADGGYGGTGYVEIRYRMNP